MTDHTSEDRQIALDWLEIATELTTHRPDHFKAAQVHALLDIAAAIREATDAEDERRAADRVERDHPVELAELREALADLPVVPRD